MSEIPDTMKNKEAAARLGVCTRTLLNWSRHNYGPPHYDISGRRYYNPLDITKWQEQQKSSVEQRGDVLKTKEVAAQLGVCSATLLTWNRNGYGPPFFEVGRKRHRYYQRQELEKWLLTRHTGGR